MPKRKYTGSRYGRRKRRRTVARRRRRPRMQLTRQLGLGFSAAQLVNMRYVTRFSIDPLAVGVAANYHFRANSIFDPDYQIGGGQPMTYDQWSQFYDHYVVVGSKIRCTFVNLSTDAKQTIMGGVLLQDQAKAVVTIEQLMEQRNVRSKVIGTSNGGNGAKPVTQRFSAKRFFGVSNISDNIDRLGGTFGANATDSAIFTVYAASFTANEDIEPISCIAEIDYSVLLTEPRLQNRS